MEMDLLNMKSGTSKMHSLLCQSAYGIDFAVSHVALGDVSQGESLLSRVYSMLIGRYISSPTIFERRLV